MPAESELLISCRRAWPSPALDMEACWRRGRDRGGGGGGGGGGRREEGGIRGRGRVEEEEVEEEEEEGNEGAWQEGERGGRR